MNQARPVRARRGSHLLAGVHRRHHRVAAALLASAIAVGAAAIALPASGLTLHAGDWNVTKCGVVIDHTEVQGDVVVRAGNGHRTIYASEAAAKADACVTITNSKVDGVVDASYTSRGFGPVFVADTTIHNPTPRDAACISESKYHAWRITVSGCRAGAHTDGYTEIHDSQLVADTEYQSAHMQALLSNGSYGAPNLFDGNSFLCAPTGPVPNGAGCAADVGLFGDKSAITNVTMTNNTFKTTNDAYYCAYTGADLSTKPFPHGSNLTWRNNIFERGSGGKCAGTDAVRDWNNSAGTWCNNQWDNGGFVLATDQCQGSTTTSSSSTTTRPSTTTTSSSTSTTRAPTTTSTSTSTTTVPTTPTTEGLDIHCTAPPLNCKVKP